MTSSKKEDNFDPFNPISKDTSDDKVEKKSDDNVNILYITVGLILLLILIWVIVVIMTREDNIEILNEMAKANNQTKLAIDK